MFRTSIILQPFLANISSKEGLANEQRVKKWGSVSEKIYYP